MQSVSRNRYIVKVFVICIRCIERKVCFLNISKTLKILQKIKVCRKSRTKSIRTILQCTFIILLIFLSRRVLGKIKNSIFSTKITFTTKDKNNASSFGPIADLISQFFQNVQIYYTCTHKTKSYSYIHGVNYIRDNYPKKELAYAQIK